MTLQLLTLLLTPTSEGVGARLHGFQGNCAGGEASGIRAQETSLPQLKGFALHGWDGAAGAGRALSCYKTLERSVV